MKLVLATNNKNKIIEIKNKFSDIPDLELIPLEKFENVPEVIENGQTFKENACKKAQEICHFTGMPCIADDSGLVVDALGGRPGVQSARYGGPDITDRDRNLAILSEMSGVGKGRRSARFICIIAIALPDARCYTAEGNCEGTISLEMKGAHGFGYDPIFYLDDLGKTMAEIPLEEKNRISHRAKALEKAREILLTIRAADDA